MTEIITDEPRIHDHGDTGFCAFGAGKWIAAQPTASDLAKGANANALIVTHCPWCGLKLSNPPATPDAQNPSLKGAV